MSLNLRVGIIAVSVILFLIIIMILKKDRIPVKYSLVWISSSFLLLIVALLPDILFSLSKFLGFETMSNMIIGIFIFILLLITLSLTVIVSGQKKKIIMLIQEVSILKMKVDDK